MDNDAKRLSLYTNLFPSSAPKPPTPIEPLCPELPPELLSLAAAKFLPQTKENERYPCTRILEQEMEIIMKGTALNQLSAWISEQFGGTKTPKFADAFDSDLSDFERYDRAVRRENELHKMIADTYYASEPVLGSQLTLSASISHLQNFYAEESTEKPKNREQKRITCSLTPDIDAENVCGSLGSSTVADSASIAFSKNCAPTWNGSTDVSTIKDKDLENGASVTPPSIQRKLLSRALQMIAFGSALGNGLLLYSGKNFTVLGPLGTLLGFFISGIIVVALMVSYCEVVTVIPIADGISGLALRFVDDALGFALGWTYWAAFAVCVPSEIIAALVMLGNIPGDASAVGWVFLFVLAVVAVNLLDVRWFGEVEYVCNLVKIVFMMVVSIVLVAISTGLSPTHEKIGARYWGTESGSAYGNATFGAFRPTYDLTDTGMGAHGGLGGATGRFMAVMTSIGVASYAYCGTEIVGIAASEAVNPRTALPAATKKVFLRVLFFYVFAVFLVGFTIYAGDPRLIRYVTSNEKYNPSSFPYVQAEHERLLLLGVQVCQTPIKSLSSAQNRSPWVIAAQSVGLCSYSYVLDRFIVFFTLSSASAQLYASSRTLHALLMQSKAPQIFRRCSKGGVPFVAVLFTGLFAFLALFALSKQALAVFEYLATITSTFVILTWGGMCLAYVRFFYALKLRDDIISREDPLYPFRLPFQPWLAMFGLCGTGVIVVCLSMSICVQGRFEVSVFLLSLGLLIAFFMVFLVYKMVYNTRVRRLDQIDLDTGRKEMDKVVWEENMMGGGGFKRWASKIGRGK